MNWPTCDSNAHLMELIIKKTHLSLNTGMFFDIERHRVDTKKNVKNARLQKIKNIFYTLFNARL